VREPASEPSTPSAWIGDLRGYQTLPRITGLALAPDGTRLVATVSALDPDGTRFRPALWEIDPAGQRPARRLTRGATGESAPAFLPDGDLLFTSARPDPQAKDQPDDAPAALWRLPAGGESHVAGTRPGGVSGPVVARTAGTVVASSLTMPAAGTAEEDEARRADRRERKVTAILHAGYPVRHWDADLGPDQPRLLAGSVPADGPVVWRDLTPAPGGALRDASYDVTPDGATAVTSWAVAQPCGTTRTILVAIDVATDSAHDQRSGARGRAGHRPPRRTTDHTPQNRAMITASARRTVHHTSPGARTPITGVARNARATCRAS
jgi:hypothetical protein